MEDTVKQSIINFKQAKEIYLAAKKEWRRAVDESICSKEDTVIEVTECDGKCPYYQSVTLGSGWCRGENKKFQLENYPNFPEFCPLLNGSVTVKIK